ncbi:MAG: F0F1 ATP synthase subunit B [Phycisphaerales bacterium]
MSINVTLFVQMIVFAIVIWVTMTYIWPLMRGAMDEREQRIADGLTAAARGQSDLLEAGAKAQTIVSEARGQAKEIVAQASGRATDIVDEARAGGEAEKRRQLEAAKAEIEVEINRARDQLRSEVAAIAVAGAAKVLAREIDSSTHRDLLDDLASEL